MDKDRLIKLLREECENLWQCEMTSYLDKEDSAELEKLLEEYDAEQEQIQIDECVDSIIYKYAW